MRTHLGRAKYVLSSRERPKDPEQAAGHVLRDFARSTAVAQNLVVVRCEIGTASTVARQIDNLNHTDVVGTLAGDDTFLIILRDHGTAARDAALRRSSPRGLARRHLSRARQPAGRTWRGAGAAVDRRPGAARDSRALRRRARQPRLRTQPKGTHQ